MDMRMIAARSYTEARTAAAPQPGSGTGGLAAAAEEFAQVLAAGETASQAALTGGGDPHALVQALSASQLAVETAVTLRDKVVEAYQEILRMPV